jgi:hypothetical protein
MRGIPVKVEEPREIGGVLDITRESILIVE